MTPNTDMESAEVLTDLDEEFNNPVVLAERVYQLWWNWADFHLYVLSPHIETILPGLVHEAEQLANNEKEFVYSIHDTGDSLSTSKSAQFISAGKSMCKLFYTIEKMVFLLVERLKSGGIDPAEEVQVALSGHLLAQRKAFESIINLNYNVVVTNFDPDEVNNWGNSYLKNVKCISDKGYGYPTEAPRTPYRNQYDSPGSGIKQK